MSRSTFAKIVMGTAALAIGALSCLQTAAAFPERPITIVVGFPAGSPNDVLGRSIGERLSKRVGQPVVIENRPGAAGMTATLDFVKNSQPDGYRLIIGSVSLGTALAIRKNHPGFDAREDLTPLAMINRSPMAISIPAQIPANTLQEFFAYAKERPGQLNYASVGGLGGAVHLYSVLFLQNAGLDLVHVPYPGSAAAVPALMDNQVQLFVVDNSSVLGGIQTGKIKVLSVASPDRISVLPDVPTTREAGLDFQAAAWYGVFAPRDIPEETRAFLEGHLAAIQKDESFKQELATRGSIASDLTGEAFRDFLKAEVETWIQVVKDAKLEQQ